MLLLLQIPDTLVETGLTVSVAIAIALASILLKIFDRISKLSERVKTLETVWEYKLLPVVDFLDKETLRLIHSDHDPRKFDKYIDLIEAGKATLEDLKEFRDKLVFVIRNDRDSTEPQVRYAPLALMKVNGMILEIEAKQNGQPR